MLAVSTLDEAISLRDSGIVAPILLLGQRHPNELTTCVELGLICTISDLTIGELLSDVAVHRGLVNPVHYKIDTGLNRFGFPWPHALGALEKLIRFPGLKLQGLYSHFAMSDEPDKTFARLQMERFSNVVSAMEPLKLQGLTKHFCNSGGFLSLPEAHLDAVRLGLLPLGVYPSLSCRRLPGIEPIMRVVSRLSLVRKLLPGDTVGYGMSYTAPHKRTIGIVPLGYGDGFPRIRNEGYVVLRGRRCPIVGGVSMDAMAIDITDIPEAKPWDSVTIQGEDGSECIDAHQIAKWRGSVSYETLTSWRGRLPRIYVNLNP